MRKTTTTTAIALSVLLATGCANMTPSSERAAAENAVPAASRTYVDAFDLSGRLSVQYQQNDKDEAIHASFTWHQTRDRSMIEILSPLGQILATISVGPDSATLVQSGHAAQTANDADALTLQTLGWPLPVAGLRSWLQGFATDAGGKPFIATAANSRVMTNDGWQIQYVDWQDEPGAAARHPKRIDLERQTAQAGKVAIRIVIDSWQAH